MNKNCIHNREGIDGLLYLVDILCIEHFDEFCKQLFKCCIVEQFPLIISLSRKQNLKLIVEYNVDQVVDEATVEAKLSFYFIRHSKQLKVEDTEN